MKSNHILPIILAGLLAFFALPLHAQPTPAQLERVATLVEQGKIEAAKATTETLLEIHPGDPQLVEIQKLFASAQQAAAKPATAAVQPPVPARPQPPALSSTDRLEIDTLIQGTRQALSLADPTQRADRLKALLNRPIPETARTASSAQWIPYWQARAVAALELKDYRQGWQAGQALLKLNALDSEDASVRQVVAALNAEGWLEKDLKTIEASAAAKRWKPWLGTWQAEASCDYRNKSDGNSTSSGYQNQKQTLAIEWLNNQPNLKMEWFRETSNRTWSGNNSSRDENTMSSITPGKLTSNSRDLSRHGTSTGSFSATNRILDITLNEAGDILTVKTERKNDGNGKVTTGESRFMLSADGRQLYILGKDSGQTRSDFARYNGSLYICKDYTSLDAPVIVALAKQN